MHTIGLDAIILGIDFHARHGIVEFHILLTNGAAVLDGFDTLVEFVRCYVAAGDRGCGDEEDGCCGDERCEHGAGDNRLNSWD